MNISVKSEYALKALFDLASQQLLTRNNPGSMQPVKIADIARRQKIPQKFLELILAGLKQSGFVDSRRGAEGGYLLARPPDLITVGEVLRSVENLKSAVRGQARDPFADIWCQVDQAVSEVLDGTTFADLARQWQEKNTEYVPNWDI
ncbi:MAG: Rrf2 family transcriptional regulator [Acidobacteriaceae bacterium]|nr:Rrf2 family transcriptional regulator [Acidobacteriaceae bacterium]